MADDDATLRETLVVILDSAGYEVLQAANGDEALRTLDQQQVDVLILDLAMPRRDGLWVLEALRPTGPKVVILSAFAYYRPEEIENRGLGGNVTKTLQKPCPPLDLLAAVNDALAH